MKAPLQERFDAKYIPEPNSGCWLWIGSVNTNGYGQIQFGKKLGRAHRVSLYLDGRDIPDGLVVDHLCGNRQCVNPSHLEAVTQQENTVRGMRAHPRKKPSHCGFGHEMVAENTYVRPDTGVWVCIECRRKHGRTYCRKVRAK